MDHTTFATNAQSLKHVIQISVILAKDGIHGFQVHFDDREPMLIDGASGERLHKDSGQRQPAVLD